MRVLLTAIRCGKGDVERNLAVEHDGPEATAARQEAATMASAPSY